MAGLIPQSFIDDLLDRVDIVDVVDSRVKLKRSGKNYSACCPFHDEKTPSFTVSPEKQFYYCFGCGASGNALGFVMDYERLSFPEAVEQLARITGLEVPREVQSEAEAKREQEKKSIYSLLEKADDFYQHQLRQHPSKHLAVNYLKGRGLDGKTAKTYGVGFAPPGWDNLLKTLGQDDDDKHLLIQGGMLIHQEQEKKLYDRFRHRIMFPIRDTRGRVIGFGGRVLGDDKPKYLNSPETPVFHKGQELYGLYEARLAYRELPRLLVVEGYMDVVSLAQFGIGYGVATLGTACGPDHLDRAFKYTSEVVFCFDGDKAGRSAALRALDAALETMADGRAVKFLFLPEGEDPDTLVRQIGPDKFEHMIELAVPLEDYLFDAVAEGLNIRTMEGRATFSKRAAPLLDRLPKGVFRELMFENLATRTGLNRRLLDELIADQKAKGEDFISTATREAGPHTSGHPAPGEERIPKVTLPRQEPVWFSAPQLPEPSGHIVEEAPPVDYQHYYQGHHSPTDREPPASPPNFSSRYLMPPARKALALLLAHPSLATTEPDHDAWLTEEDEDLQLLGRLLKVLHERPHYNLSHLIGYWRGTYGPDNTEKLAAVAGHDLLQAATALTRPRQDKPAKADYDAEAGFSGAIQALRRQQIDKKSAQSLAKLKTADFTQLSKAEREQLVREALAPKLGGTKPAEPIPPDSM
ncbi:DNA primase [Cellvibrio japonicus]|uniref:DNA primase n=1 Tax=Cellvibrio japonicus (strain Ueda107) TaxID=498211 RepID=B3PKA2_CELJU|nr:DNA primase [Cellvibrio japonicus]ACE85283.1 DNA primase [Cellvibrio japonicus Ueda107]QEI11419.1 DNA primase [Cellvibrio japonicus]QEI14993.1 DNA primase [Cellvibrio japonicus]QEI18573.1 DNA primase [Cellvibrio japonicus]